MNDTEYGELLVKLRSAMHKAISLANQAICERDNLDITDARDRLENTIGFVESAIQENE